MILNEFPDLTWLKTQITQQFAGGTGWGGRILKEKGWPTVILNATASKVRRDQIAGPLSLFSNTHGASSVGVDNKRVKIIPGYFFLTNPSQRYTLEIDQSLQPDKTRTFNIHFGERFGEQVFASLLQQPESLLENHFEKQSSNLEFYNRLYPIDQILEKHIQSIPSDTLGEEEKLFDLLHYLFVQLERLKKASHRLPAVKAATREEIIKRLFISTDYIYTFFHDDLSLEELARISCLSKFHYLRLFRIAFGETPHQFITKVRLQRAKELLRKPDLEITTISRLVGFDNPSSFSRLFYNQTGVYPTQFRA